jgi:hypothetical protein
MKSYTLVCGQHNVRSSSENCTGQIGNRVSTLLGRKFDLKRDTLICGRHNRWSPSENCKGQNMNKASTL